MIIKQIFNKYNLPKIQKNYTNSAFVNKAIVVVKLGDLIDSKERSANKRFFTINCYFITIKNNIL